MKLINRCTDEVENHKLKTFLSQLERGDRAFEFQSSGSTGKPKTFLFSREQLNISAYQTIDFFGLHEESKLICPFSMDFVAAKMMVVRAYLLHATLVFTGPIKNPLTLNELSDASLLALVPMQLDAALEKPDTVAALNSATNVLVGGAGISARLHLKIKKEVQTNIYHSYGMTETLTHIALRKLWVDDSVYEPLPNVQLDTDERSCLKVKSPVTGTWLRTMDIVDLKMDGFLWKGRFDLVINSGGFKIHPISLEDKIEVYYPEIQLYICGITSDKFGEEVCAVSNTAMPKDFGRIFSNVEFHRYEKPKKWIQMHEIPRNRTGKIQRARLNELAQQVVIDGQHQQVV